MSRFFRKENNKGNIQTPDNMVAPGESEYSTSDPHMHSSAVAEKKSQRRSSSVPAEEMIANTGKVTSSQRRPSQASLKAMAMRNGSQQAQSPQAGYRTHGNDNAQYHPEQMIQPPSTPHNPFNGGQSTSASSAANSSQYPQRRPAYLLHRDLVIGRGSYGQVCIASRGEAEGGKTGKRKKFACKCVMLRSDPKYIAKLQEEVNVLREVSFLIDLLLNEVNEV